MNEWPTRARTGVPPSSRTSSGTAFEQIRLWTTVRSSGGASAGSRSRIARATSAVVSDPLIGCAVIVDEEHSIGVAVEREPDVCALVDDRGAAGHGGSPAGSGSAGWFGKVPSSSPKRIDERSGRPVEDRGHDEPTDAVRRVRDDAKRRERRHVDERVDVRDELGEEITLLDAPGASASSSRPAATVALIWRSPVSSPTGAAPARQSLMPWYCAGL